ncbi:MAG: hypothetical protein ABI758_05300 [Candidatus Woesebacteria bacterium]
MQIEITQEEKVISQGLVTLYHNERIAYRDAAGVEHAIGAFYLENGAPVFHSSAAEPFATFATTPRSLKEIVDVMRSNMTMGDFEWIFLQTKGRDTVGKMVSFQTFWDEFQRLHPELFKNA